MRSSILLAVCALMIVPVGCRKKPPTPPVPTADERDAVKNRFLAIDDVDKAVVLEQNWPNDKANWFYNVTQGSQLMPYTWFLHLEQADSKDLFRDDKNMRDLGFLPRSPGGENKDGLPIGFAKDEGDTDWVGLNCAACHTSQINYENVGYLVDGSAALADLSGFLRTLVAALEKTASDSEKFDRFAGKVLGANPSDTDKGKLKEGLARVIKVRKGYNDRNVIHDHDYARIDAFGSILNETTSRFIEITENIRPANAPVSIPFIWDAPQHDVVQWNGSASNAGLLGALGRNTGEVLGVFGNFGKDNIPIDTSVFPGYASTVRFNNLRKIENTLAELWSPLWPDEFPKPDADMVAKGKVLFGEYCADCHKPIKRTDPNRKIIAQMDAVATDPTMSDNFTNRTGMITGRLEGRRIRPLGDRFTDTSTGEYILVHEVAYAILGFYKTTPEDDLKDLMIPKVDAAAIVEPGPKYKGRPLNGIWATAPYLHNGSVHNLYQLLLPAAERDKKFWVGSHDFDPVGVGFKIDKGGSELDTSLPGNSNAGHEYGTGVSEDDNGDGLDKLTDEERKQLVEYMKTL